MRATLEAHLEAGVAQPLAMHARAHAGGVEHIDRALLEHAGADAVLDVLAAVILDDHAVDAAQLQQPREQQAGGARADDADLGAHVHRGMMPCTA